MSSFGIDSSNYRSSAAFYNSDGTYSSFRKLLYVENGKLGLRQSDAVFAQTRQLPEIVEQALDGAGNIECIAVSDRPRPLNDSYMPCFLVGVSVARAVSAALKVPMFRFSHQEGHISAALFSSNRTDLFSKQFIAFHVSGGTTEALLVTPSGSGFCVDIIGKTLDLHAGQLIDRVGVMLGLGFPSGEQLEKLALNGIADNNVKLCVNGYNCNLSGMENVCRKMLDSGVSKNDIAATAIDFVGRTILKIAENIKEQYDLPIIFSGGVMADKYIKSLILNKIEADFASLELSGDNAVGIALLGYKKLSSLR